MNVGIVAIVGRPNVGKSTLFNRLIRRNKSIIADQPGVTRDCIYGDWELDFEKYCMLVDTGGFETDKDTLQPFAGNLVWQQTLAAIEQSDIVMFLVDATVGLHPDDKIIYQHLRQTNKPIVIAVNKTDKGKTQHAMYEFHALGVDKVYPISGTHGSGMHELIERIEEIFEELQSTGKETPKDIFASVAIVGRPNVGKSSFLNRIVGSNRSLVSDVPGTTRDRIDVVVHYNNNNYQLVDTAGMRRRTHVHDKIEVISSIRAYRAIQRADIVLLMLDATRGLEDQDARIARLSTEQNKPVIIIINKWDLVENKNNKTIQEWKDAIRRKLKDISYSPILFISCEINQRVHQVMQEVESVALLLRKRASTALINSTLQDIVHHHQPALVKSFTKRAKFYYATQVQIQPPTIVIKCNVAKAIQESYKRYLTHQLRERLGFEKIQPVLIFRDKDASAEMNQETQH